MAGYRDLTMEQTIKVRGILAERCGLVLFAPGRNVLGGREPAIYLLDGEEFCAVSEWQPDFNAEHAEMVDVVMFVVSEVLMEQTDTDKSRKQYRYSGVVAYDKPYVRTEWEDSLAGAIFDGAVRALQMEGAI